MLIMTQRRKYTRFTIKDVQTLARHSTITLTFDYYGHESSDLSHKVRALPRP